MSTPLADGELAALLRRAIVDEDREAFDRLFDSQAGRLEVLLQSRLPRAARGRIDVEDVLQETYTRAYRRFRRIPDVTPEIFRRWIVHIALRELKRVYETHLGTIRRSADRERRVESHSRFAARSDGTPSHLAGRRESVAILVEVLEDMPADYREVILLRDFEGFTTEMIAARMNRSVTALDVLYHRALLGLSDRLQVRGLSASRY